jgi:hypothetical protein
MGRFSIATLMSCVASPPSRYEEDVPQVPNRAVQRSLRATVHAGRIIRSLPLLYLVIFTHRLGLYYTKLLQNKSSFIISFIFVPLQVYCGYC